MTYLFDTDTVILMMRGMKLIHAKSLSQRQRGRQAAHILSRCREQSKQGHRLAISAITVAELEFGAYNSDQYEVEIRATRLAIAAFDLLDFTAAACCEPYGRLRHHLTSAGKIIGANDLLIAAHALALDATVITNNTREFARVPGLKVENWSAE
ncbi:MAG: PIN domain-containing protein [Prosthecobacter sp.]|nr:PIN domain-containing protein [Prosthecobacter sp.]